MAARFGLGSRARNDRPVPLLVSARDDPGAFAELYEELYDRVLRYLARRTFDPEVAFDLAAEAFAKAFAMRFAFRGSTDQEAYAWIWTIVRNQLAAWYERGRVERDAVWRLGLQPLALTDHELERVEELADLERERHRVALALESLTPDQALAVRYRILDDMSYPAIAEALQVSQEVARSRVSRGLRAMWVTLGPDDTLMP